MCSAEMRMLLFVTVLLGVAYEAWAGERCCPGLGCYSDDPLFVLFPLPQCPEDMGMNIQMYTNQHLNIGQNVDRNTIPSVFNAEVKTIFLVHGWQKSEDYPWLHDVNNNALAQSDYNIVIVGWKVGAASTFYPQPASNTRTVGGEIALIASNLINNGHSSKALMYCVGHSLGAHACGHAGQRGQIGRISGLDPAGPLFEDRDPSAGLNPSCADLVDIIHTNGRIFGTLRTLGHIDFYPNGGIHQPGCIRDMADELVGRIPPLIKDNTTPSLDLVTNCDHARAFEFFNESIVTPCFRSRSKCIPILNLPGPCTQSGGTVQQSMGFNADSYPSQGIFSLETRDSPPYCLG